MKERVTPMPTARTDLEPFWSSMTEQNMRLQHCAQCGSWNGLPPVPRCRRCHCTALTWEPVRGTGTIESFTVSYPLLMKQLTEPVTFVRVVLDEQQGLIVIGQLLDEVRPADPIGQRVAMYYGMALDGRTTVAHFRIQN